MIFKRNKETVSEKRFQGGKHVKSMVYGGLDGIITTFAVVSGVAGASLAGRVVIILGFSNLLADGISMAVGDYLSTKSEKEYKDEVKKQQKEKFAQNYDNEVEMLVHSFEKEGLTTEDAETISYTLSKYTDSFLKHKMTSEYGNEETSEDPLKNALVTFFSFVVFGLVPLLAYVASMFLPIMFDNAFLVASILIGITLFILGTVKSRITYSNWIRSGIEMLAVGGLAAVAAYLIGYILGGI
jgi:VIT1/CCC1 family predicted Fe2+/Mn2+ transporter